MSIGDVLKAGLSSFSPQERRVARVLLADYPRAALGTSAELAAAAGVSPPTVVRFARSLGHSGFPALQQALLDELSERVASPLSLYEDTRAHRAEGHWLDLGVQVATASIAQSLTAIPKAELDAAVTLLADPRMRITAMGGRFSGYLAGY
ncbi:MAG TPA: MurR/RpiR family transcriptional regulator, partial [Blastococcus sp.]